MNVAILGAGSGGLSAAVELSLNGHTTQLWHRPTKHLAPFAADKRIHYTGTLGQGSVAPALISDDINRVLEAAEVILVCLPTFAHRSIAELLVETGHLKTPVILNPGHTGGALEFYQVFRVADKTPPPIAEFSTLTYVARKPASNIVAIAGSAKRVWVAALPGGARAHEYAQMLYPSATSATDVIATGLSNVNLVLHPPGAVLAAAWVESTAGGFTFYVDGLPAGVGRIMEALDEERIKVAAAYDHDLPTLFMEMQAIGTIEQNADMKAGLAAAVRGGTANENIKAPDSLTHRYYIEDFCYGLQPFLTLARIAEVEAPVAQSLMRLVKILLGAGIPEGRTSASMGITGLTRQQLIKKIRA